MAKEDKTSKNDSQSASSPDLEHLKGLYDLMLEKGLDTVELRQNDSIIKLSRSSAGAHGGHWIPAQPAYHPPVAGEGPGAAAPASAESAPADSKNSINAPLAGVFYRASSPTTPAFVKEGDVVDPGQTLCIVEAMKVMNEIKAESRCRIVRIAVENSRPVTAGQALFMVEPA